MLDKLLDIILKFVENITPWVVLREYQEGVLLRLGRYRRVMGPGFHLMIPFVDHVDEVVTVWTTFSLPVQTIATKDGRIVIAKGMVKCRVSDAKAYMIDTYDAKDAMSDTVCGIIFDTIHSMNYADCMAVDMDELITPQAKKEAKKWGITVRDVTLTDFGEVRSLRLFNERTELY